MICTLKSAQDDHKKAGTRWKAWAEYKINKILDEVRLAWCSDAHLGVLAAIDIGLDRSKRNKSWDLSLGYKPSS
jgi:hypothetical protein